MPKPEDKPKEFREIRVGHLAARVYKDGRTCIGSKVETLGPGSEPSIEIEVQMNTKQGREFAEGLLGIINQHEGRY